MLFEAQPRPVSAAGLPLFSLRSVAVLGLLAAAFLARPALAVLPPPPTSITMAWDPSPDPDVIGYNVYYGAASGQYTNVISAGATNAATIGALLAGQEYFFSVTSINGSGLESPFSDEISFMAGTSVPSRLQIGFVTASTVMLRGMGEASTSYTLQSSTDNRNWTSLLTVTTDPTGSFQLTDPNAAKYKARYFRLLRAP